MDPNANLKEQDALLHALSEENKVESLERLRTLRIALRTWILARSVHPRWETYPRATAEFTAWWNRTALKAYGRKRREARHFSGDKS